MHNDLKSEHEKREESLRTITTVYASMALICAGAALFFVYFPSGDGTERTQANYVATGFTFLSVANLGLVSFWRVVLRGTRSG